MANRLPEKLTALRKHYGLSQGDLAEKLGVSVMEYMNWENGNKICTIQTLIRIADIFKVTPDELADNRKELDMPQLGSDDSIDIPFINPDLSGGETELPQKALSWYRNRWMKGIRRLFRQAGRQRLRQMRIPRRRYWIPRASSGQSQMKS